MNNRDLYDRYDKMLELKRSTYEKIFNRCVNIIKINSKKGELCCNFIIPNYIFGDLYPNVNIPLCVDYINYKLDKLNKNIKTTFISPNILVLDWRKSI